MRKLHFLPLQNKIQKILKQSKDMETGYICLKISTQLYKNNDFFCGFGTQQLLKKKLDTQSLKMDLFFINVINYVSMNL